MSIKIMSLVFQHYPNGSGEMLTALALADHARDNGTHIYPSVASLAQKTRQSERTVQYQLRKMQADGWLVLEHEGGAGAHDTNRYSISVQWLQGADSAGCNPQQENTNKGATDSNKGAIAVAPESSIEPSVREPSSIVRPEAGRFPEFWRKYPKKVKRREAEALWKRKKLDALADDILSDVAERIIEDGRWLAGFVPDPPTYLRGERWNDEISEVRK